MAPRYQDHPQKLIQIFQVDGRVGRFSLVKPGQPPKCAPNCLFSWNSFEISIEHAKK